MRFVSARCCSGVITTRPAGKFDVHFFNTPWISSSRLLMSMDIGGGLIVIRFMKRSRSRLEGLLEGALALLVGVADRGEVVSSAGLTSGPLETHVEEGPQLLPGASVAMPSFSIFRLVRSTSLALGEWRVDLDPDITSERGPEVRHLEKGPCNAFRRSKSTTISPTWKMLNEASHAGAGQELRTFFDMGFKRAESDLR